MSGPQAFVIQNDTTIVWDNFLYPGGTSLARYYPGWELRVSPWDKAFVWNNAGQASIPLTAPLFVSDWNLRASQYDSVYVWGVYGTHHGNVNPRARWVIPNPVLHNKEQAVVQKAIDVKIKAIRKVESKLSLKDLLSTAERKALLKRLADLEQALERLIDLFEFKAQQATKLDAQIPELESITLELLKKEQQRRIEEEEEFIISFLIGMEL